MTNLRDYDRDALITEKVRDLERQLADARESLDIAYFKGLADGRAEIGRLRGLLRESSVKFEAYQSDGLKMPVNLMRRIRDELGDE